MCPGEMAVREPFSQGVKGRARSQNADPKIDTYFGTFPSEIRIFIQFHQLLYKIDNSGKLPTTYDRTYVCIDKVWRGLYHLCVYTRRIIRCFSALYAHHSPATWWRRHSRYVLAHF